ncbi:MAG: T9SS type A sorting domain-containing protein [Bacteroidota bacterium]
MNTVTRCTWMLFCLALFWGISPLSGQVLYEIHWDDAGDPNFTGSGGGALTQIIDAGCSSIELSVTDTANSPLGAFNALIINPQIPGGGGDLVDLSGNMSFYVRVRSRETVTLGLLLRAGDGTSAFRTSRITENVPGDTTSWTELVFTFDNTDLGGFDSTDLRDIWFYLDPGTSNFAGNEFYFDYFSIGEAPDSSLNSTCPVDTMPTAPSNVSYAIHYDSQSDPLFTGSAAATLSQTIDSACSQLFLTVTDPINNPWSGTGPIIINPRDTAGNDITDLSGSMAFHVRVRSVDTVQLALRLRAGDGTAAFRTDRLSLTVPGDTMQWTELTYIFDSTNLAGFDSMDLRDIWLHLDYGEANFAGNRFWIDYFAIGPKPDVATHSPCSLLPPFEFPWVRHWADTLDEITTGSGAAFLTQTLDTNCSELKISVTEPVLGPHPAFRPIIIHPKDDLGNDLQDLSGNLTLYARVKSLGEVEFSALLRGGGGTTSERSELISYTVPAGLDQWTELAFDFSGSNLGGFDSTDLRDIFFFLNREEANFSGNEFYIDYVSIGSTPDTALNSPCVTTSVDISQEQEVALFPNPMQAGKPIYLSLPDQQGEKVQVSLWTTSGQLMHTRDVQKASHADTYILDLPAISSGFYLLKVKSADRTYIQKLIVNQ